MEEKIIDPVEEQYAKIQAAKKFENQSKRKVEFDVKNYLNVKLTSKEIEKKLTIRILKSPDAKTPFTEVQMHYLPSAKRSYVCAKLTNGLPESVDKNCPFCDIKDEAKEQQKGANEVTWNKLKEIYKQNGTILNYVVKVIDRDDQDFGVKFWKFTQATYETIVDIYKNNKADGINIFDKYEGKDLIVTIKKKDGNSKITNISAANKQSKLADTEDEINSLITDDKVWTDVYGIKPYEYLELVIDEKVPFFDKTINKWVEKKEKVNDNTDENYEEEYNSSEDNGSENEPEQGDDLPF